MEADVQGSRAVPMLGDPSVGARLRLRTVIARSNAARSSVSDVCTRVFSCRQLQWLALRQTIAHSRIRAISALRLARVNVHANGRAALSRQRSKIDRHPATVHSLETLAINLSLPDGKSSLYEGGERMPTAVNWPGHVSVGRTIDEPMHGVDLFQTLAGLAGVAELMKKLNAHGSWQVP
jgi:hypothetical protein